MVVIIADGTEDEAVVGFDAYSTRVQQTIEANQLDERRIGTLLHYLLDAVERGADHRIPVLTGHKQLSYNQRKDYSKKIFQCVAFHVKITNKSAVYCMASHHFIKGRWESE